jgi:hypothetical protein
MANSLQSPVEKGTAYLFWCMNFVGLAGMHRFYLGKPISGALYLVTFGFFGIGQFFDLFLIPGMVETHNLKQHFLTGIKGVAQPPIKLDVQILKVCRKRNGATLSDCVIETEADVSRIKAEIHKLCVDGLLHIDNRDHDGAVIYRTI